MADIDWPTIVAIIPSMSGVAVGAQTAYLSLVNALVSDEYGGDTDPRFLLARVYLAAHMATVDAQGATGGAGPIASDTGGGLSVTYASTVGMTNTVYDSTAYGRQYKAIQRRSPVRLPRLLGGC